MTRGPASLRRRVYPTWARRSPSPSPSPRAPRPPRPVCRGLLSSPVPVPPCAGLARGSAAPPSTSRAARAPLAGPPRLPRPPSLLRPCPCADGRPPHSLSDSRRASRVGKAWRGRDARSLLRGARHASAEPTARRLGAGSFSTHGGGRGIEWARAREKRRREPGAKRDPTGLGARQRPGPRVSPVYQPSVAEGMDNRGCDPVGGAPDPRRGRWNGRHLDRGPADGPLHPDPFPAPPEPTGPWHARPPTLGEKIGGPRSPVVRRAGAGVRGPATPPSRPLSLGVASGPPSRAAVGPEKRFGLSTASPLRPPSQERWRPGIATDERKDPRARSGGGWGSGPRGPTFPIGLSGDVRPTLDQRLEVRRPTQTAGPPPP